MSKKKQQVKEESKTESDTFITSNVVEADKVTSQNFKKYKVARDSGKYQLFEISKMANDLDISPNEILLITDNYTYLYKKFSEKTLDKKKKNM